MNTSKRGRDYFLAVGGPTKNTFTNRCDDIVGGSFLILMSGTIHIDVNLLSGQKISSHGITQPLEACFMTASI
jgi:hypothetical protein